MTTTDPLAGINTRVTPQNQKADPAQFLAQGGGYTFVADDMTRLRRFLATGVEGGTFYASEKDNAFEAGTLVLDLIGSGRGREVLDTVVDMSTRGATTRQQPLMFTLAALSGAQDAEVRTEALRALSTVARTASHLFLFASYVEQFRGWGKGLRKAVARWYDDKDVDSLAYQIEKYRSRYGYSHRDMLLLGHVGSRQSGSKSLDGGRGTLYAHAAGKPVDGGLPHVTVLANMLRESGSPETTAAIIESASRISWEMVKSEHLADKRVWEALLDGGHVPIGALIRNLSRLTANGVLDPFGQDDRTARIIGRLRDSEALAKGRVHPMSVLLAAATYASGRSLRGDSTWRPIPNINKGLDAAFMAAFATITPEPDKRAVIAVDISQSMDTNSVAGLPMSCRTAAVGLAQTLAAQFPRNMGMAFSGPNLGTPGRGYLNTPTEMLPFDVDPGRRLTDLIAEAQTFPFGSTDCSAPVMYALEKRLHVDAFIVLTDNETNSGSIHPHQALRKYREQTGVQARMVTVAMQHNRSTIADPSDPLMLDCVGLDSNVVSLVGDFVSGRV